ncbi:hypothetical protein FSC49_03590 [Pseudomonas aeruginosa]|nr:hypothetical protein FSC49_03590 [Pseudomonas aeruginosa]
MQVLPDAPATDIPALSHRREEGIRCPEGTFCGRGGKRAPQITPRRAQHRAPPQVTFTDPPARRRRIPSTRPAPTSCSRASGARIHRGAVGGITATL